MIRIERFDAAHADAVSAMCSAEGWESFADLEAVRRAFSAPGVTALVALEGSAVVGAAQLLSDAAINAYLGTLIVHASRRGSGIGTSLVRELFASTRANRIDLLTEDGGPRFYRTLRHRELLGFRLYPERR